jgi:hypothetical protein
VYVEPRYASGEEEFTNPASIAFLSVFSQSKPVFCFHTSSTFRPRDGNGLLPDAFGRTLTELKGTKMVSVHLGDENGVSSFILGTKMVSVHLFYIERRKMN